MRKRLAALLLALCLFITCAIPAFAVTPEDLRNNGDFYAKQQTSITCTLASAAMMMRRRAYFDGMDNWNTISESNLRRVAWSYVGLSHDFSMLGITVLHGEFDKDAAVEDQLVGMLKDHPEGIVVYNKYVPHAILVTDYTDGSFYCSDPSSSAPSGRVPLSEASISISKARYFWYVADDTNRPAGITGSLTATGITYPTRITKGTGYALAGTLSSPGNITNVSMNITTDAGTQVLTAAVDPETPEYDLAAFADQVDFSTLTTGSYTMQLAADDEYGARISLRKRLTVSNGELETASYSGTAPTLSDINAVNLVETGFDVESTATDEDGGAVSVIYAAWADGSRFAQDLVATRDGDKFTTHISANASLLALDSFLINITVMDADGNTARGALLVKVGVDDGGDDTAEGTLVADQTVVGT